MSDPLDVMEASNITPIKTEEAPKPQQEITTRMARRVPSKEEWDAAHKPPEPVVEPVVAPVVEPVVVSEPKPEPVVVPVEPPKVFEVSEQWQAKDENGKPVGPPSKITGSGPTELDAYKDLAAKLRDINIEAAKRIKTYRDKYRTYDAAKNTFVFTEPKALSPEEKVHIARLLADPDTLDQGYAELYKAQFGESPDQARKRMAEEAEAASVVAAQRETSQFLADHPDFPQGQRALQVMIEEMGKMKEEAETNGQTFGWTAHNLEIAYDNLVEKGTLVPIQLTQTKVSEPTPTSQIASQSRASQEMPPQVATPAQPVAPSANTEEANGNLRPRGTRHSNMSTEHGEAPPATRQTDDAEFLKQVDEMPLEVFKGKIKNDRAFRERLNTAKRR